MSTSFSYNYANQAISVMSEIENELTKSGIQQLSDYAQKVGLDSWIQQLSALHEEAHTLVALTVSQWKKNRIFVSKTHEERLLLLCAMYLTAKEGQVLLHHLAAYGHALLPGGSYRSTVVDAASFVDTLYQDLPDPYWPFDQESPFA